MQKCEVYEVRNGEYYKLRTGYTETPVYEHVGRKPVEYKQKQSSNNRDKDNAGTE